MFSEGSLGSIPWDVAVVLATLFVTGLGFMWALWAILATPAFRSKQATAKPLCGSARRRLKRLAARQGGDQAGLSTVERVKGRQKSKSRRAPKQTTQKAPEYPETGSPVPIQERAILEDHVKVEDENAITNEPRIAEIQTEDNEIDAPNGPDVVASAAAAAAATAAHADTIAQMQEIIDKQAADMARMRSEHEALATRLTNDLAEKDNALKLGAAVTLKLRKELAAAEATIEKDTGMIREQTETILELWADIDGLREARNPTPPDACAAAIPSKLLRKGPSFFGRDYTASTGGRAHDSVVSVGKKTVHVGMNADTPSTLASTASNSTFSRSDGSRSSKSTSPAGVTPTLSLPTSGSALSLSLPSPVTRVV